MVKHPEDPPSLDRTAVTAINTAMGMQYAGFNLCARMAEVAQELWRPTDADQQPQLTDLQQSVPSVEARYRIGSQIAGLPPNEQILEIGPGLMARGVETAVFPNVTYVEFDLPPMSDLKWRVLDQLVAREVIMDIPENLRLVAGNALRMPSLLDAAARFDRRKPLRIITEGVLHYMTHPERAQLGRNIGQLLRTFGGVWQTDMPVRRPLTSGRPSAMAEVTRQQTGRDVTALRFEDYPTAEAFFASEEAGALRVVRRDSYIDDRLVDSLQSLGSLGVGRGEYIERNWPWSMYTFTTRNLWK